MTATEPLRQWGAPNLFDLWPTALHEWRVLHGLSGQEYALYQAARGISQRRWTITIPELCDEDLVDNLTLALILDALKLTTTDLWSCDWEELEVKQNASHTEQRAAP